VLPHGFGHTTRDIAFTPGDRLMLVSVGSESNAAEGMRDPPGGLRAWIDKHPLGASWGRETGRADVLAFDPDGKNPIVFATGIRNCVGLAVHPKTGEAYCSTNERDGLGDDLPPDYLARVSQGDFFGWPYAYIGPHPDPDFGARQPALVPKTKTPDLLFQAHSAPLGLVFYEGSQFPAEYKGDAFVALHGSWNRAKPTGYKVVRIKFKNGRPAGGYDNFLTGFWDGGTSPARVWGRPVGLAVAKDGSLLISDDAGGTIWRVAYTTN